MVALLRCRSGDSGRVGDLLRNEMRQHSIPGDARQIIQNGKPAKTASYALARTHLICRSGARRPGKLAEYHCSALYQNHPFSRRFVRGMTVRGIELQTSVPIALTIIPLTPPVFSRFVPESGRTILRREASFGRGIFHKGYLHTMNPQAVHGVSFPYSPACDSSAHSIFSIHHPRFVRFHISQ
jgi:hypothetical protein